MQNKLDETLPICKFEVKDLLPVLYFTKLSRANNFETLTKYDYILIIEHLKNDFEDLPLNVLKETIIKGTKGVYNEFKQFPINMVTIYSWVYPAWEKWEKNERIRLYKLKKEESKKV